MKNTWAIFIFIHSFGLVSAISLPHSLTHAHAYIHAHTHMYVYTHTQFFESRCFKKMKVNYTASFWHVRYNLIVLENFKSCLIIHVLTILFIQIFISSSQNSSFLVKFCLKRNRYSRHFIEVLKMYTSSLVNMTHQSVLSHKM